jgi:hypothetical protein
MTWWKYARTVALAALSCSAVACSKPEPPPEPVKGPGGEEMEYVVPVAPAGTAKVSGTVKAGGKPITAGRVLFLFDQGLALSPGIIAADGTYAAEGLPTGRATIVVLLDPNGEMPFPTPNMTGGPPPTPGGDPPKMGGPPGGPPGAPPGGPPGLPPGAPPLGPPGGLLPLPDPFIQALGGYAIPPDQARLYQALHQKYSRPSKANTIKTTVGEGSNSFDITLTP